LAIRLADTQDSDIAPETGIEIVKIRTTGEHRIVDRLPYYLISPIRNNLYTTVQRRKPEYYAFRDDILLSPNDSLWVNVISPDKDIKDIKFLLERMCSTKLRIQCFDIF